MKTMKISIWVSCIMLILGITAGCKKNSETEAPEWDLNSLHGGYTKCWKTVGYYVNGVSYPIPSWAADEIFAFNEDGTAASIFGEVEKITGDTIRCDHFRWSVSGDTLTMSETIQTTGTTKVELLELTGNSFDYQFKVDVNTLFRAVYEPVVIADPNAGAMNKALTHGLSKFWKLSEVTYDGQQIQIPEWRKDDLLLFNTDGTGYFTFGETVEFPGDTTNNDRFLWWFSSNETRLEVEEISTSGMINIADCNIITLNDAVMICEEQVMINGVMTMVRVTRVPALK